MDETLSNKAVPDFEDEIDAVNVPVEFASVPDTPLLDTSAHRARAHLASNMPARRPPTKRGKVKFGIVQLTLRPACCEIVH